MAKDLESARLKRYKKGIQEILRTRNYNLTNYVEEDKYIDFFAESEDEGIITKVIVRVPLKKTVGVQEVRALHKAKENGNFDEAIIVAEERFTHYARKEAQALGIEIFESHHPMFNIFSHFLVPKHERLTEIEKRQLLKRLHLKIHQLPKIKKSDPAVKNINARPGDVIRILREGLESEEYASYRLVVDD